MSKISPGNSRIGFIGPGIMGRPMATNLIRAGFPLTVWSRSGRGIKSLVAEGAAEARHPQEMAERSDVIITMVTDSPDVEEVLLGPSGVIAAARPGLVVIDMSTISPTVTRRIAGELGAVGVDMLDAPVSGGEQGAVGGTLSIMVGGSEETFRLCRPLFEVLGTEIFHCGGSGAGQTVKLCNQIVVGLNNLAMCEALLFASRMGVSPATVMDVVAAGAGNSWAIQNLAPKILQRDFRPGFKVVDQQKDLRLILDAAGSKRLPLPGTALVRQLFAAVEAGGFEGDGTQALIRALENMAGTEVSCQ